MATLFDKLFKTCPSKSDKQRFGVLYESYLKSRKRKIKFQKASVHRLKSTSSLIDKSKFLYDIPDSMIFPNTAELDETEENADTFLKEFGEFVGKDSYIPKEVLIKLGLSHLIESNNTEGLETSSKDNVENGRTNNKIRTTNEEINNKLTKHRSTASNASSTIPRSAINNMISNLKNSTSTNDRIRQVLNMKKPIKRKSILESKIGEPSWKKPSPCKNNVSHTSKSNNEASDELEVISHVRSLFAKKPDRKEIRKRISMLSKVVKISSQNKNIIDKMSARNNHISSIKQKSNKTSPLMKFGNRRSQMVIPTLENGKFPPDFSIPPPPLSGACDESHFSASEQQARLEHSECGPYTFNMLHGEDNNVINEPTVIEHDESIYLVGTMRNRNENPTSWECNPSNMQVHNIITQSSSNEQCRGDKSSKHDNNQDNGLRKEKFTSTPQDTIELSSSTKPRIFLKNPALLLKDPSNVSSTDDSLSGQEKDSFNFYPTPELHNDFREPSFSNIPQETVSRNISQEFSCQDKESSNLCQSHREEDGCDPETARSLEQTCRTTETNTSSNLLNISVTEEINSTVHSEAVLRTETCGTNLDQSLSSNTSSLEINKELLLKTLAFNSDIMKLLENQRSYLDQLADNVDKTHTGNHGEQCCAQCTSTKFIISNQNISAEKKIELLRFQFDLKFEDPANHS